MARDPYTELGVSRTADADDIRKAFRKLAKAYHPDANPGNNAAEERFKSVSAAFDIVGDSERRRRFDNGEIDADGRETAFSAFGGGGFGGGGFGGGPRPDVEGFDLNDLFSDVFKTGGRGGGGAGAGGFGSFAAKGRDIRARLEIDIEDTISGAKKRVTFTDGRTVEVSVPQGAREGRVLRLKGQGGPARAGQSGDALIELLIRPHPVFQIDGDNLVMDLPITVPDAVLGGKVKAPTPEGLVSLQVPKGSNSGQVLRLKGKGLFDASGNRRDLLARLIVALPVTIDPELEQYCQNWRRDNPYTAKIR